MRSNQPSIELHEPLLNDEEERHITLSSSRSHYDDEDNKENDTLSETIVPIIEEDEPIIHQHLQSHVQLSSIDIDSVEPNVVEAVHLNEVETRLERLSQNVPATLNMVERNVMRSFWCERKGRVVFIMGLSMCMLAFPGIVLLREGIQNENNISIIGGSILLGSPILEVIAALGYLYYRRRMILLQDIADPLYPVTHTLSAGETLRMQTTLNELGRHDIQVNEHSNGDQIRHATSVIAQTNEPIRNSVRYNDNMKSRFFKTAEELQIPKAISEVIREYALEYPTIRPAV